MKSENDTSDFIELENNFWLSIPNSPFPNHSIHLLSKLKTTRFISFLNTWVEQLSNKPIILQCNSLLDWHQITWLMFQLPCFQELPDFCIFHNDAMYRPQVNPQQPQQLQWPYAVVPFAKLQDRQRKLLFEIQGLHVELSNHWFFSEPRNIMMKFTICMWCHHKPH